MKKSANLKAMIMAPLAGFRHTSVTVPEWGGKTFILREPSGATWTRFNELVAKLRPAESGEDEPMEPDAPEQDRLSRLADALMLVDVLLDEKGVAIFSEEDAETLAPHIGPVHSRLLRRAIDLALTFDDAQKK
ncbi:phage tail assembly chaperone [Enterobacillus tribolii]|uniref:Tail assembly chaperone n=1 Tax=Enterobacillus tribolii TaxID=1487935 RepID=A0A370R2S5_9GAMM|nr:phage tail assembly chaperone [Enterobacillus tribolii]MBW7984723.1 phage tail protein [Enterobacillus tribolii]RDK96723.1 tail assembly chaperone [Enterobacillus tribolii]